MKALFSTLLILFIGVSFSFSQNFKIKKDIVYIDGVKQFRIESIQMGDVVNIYNLEGKKIIVYRIQKYYDRNAITEANKQGAIYYYDVTFLNDNLEKCEAEFLMKKGLVSEIISNNLIVNGELNEKGIQQYKAINGTRYSEERKRSTTIIINNN